MSSAYEVAMRKEAERLAAAQKRNVAAAGMPDDETQDAKEAAWESVFKQGQSAQADTEDDARKRKYQRKAEKKKEKASAQDANAANLTLYVSNIPKDVSWTAVQSLFGRAGEVRRVKLYKDESGEQKGDGLVTFANEAGLNAAVERGEWNCFGELLHIERASFEAKPTGVPKEDWGRVAVLLHMFAVEEIAAAPSVPAFLTALTDDVWVECLRYGAVDGGASSGAGAALVLPLQEFVKLRGLKGAAERNGQVGVISSFDDATSRYTVKLRDGTLLALKRANLLQMLSVTLAGLEGEHAASNGATGTIFEYDETSGMYGVETVDGEALPVPAGCAVFADNSVGTVDGLQGAAQYNGQLARVLSHDEAAGRYVAELDGGRQLRLKRANLLA